MITQPIGAQPKREPMHIDDWLETAVMSRDKGTVYAVFFLHHRRLSAVVQSAFKEFIGPLRLFCTYGGERYRCTGASRLGDVWLARDHNRDTGYDLRVDVQDCGQWGREP